jgi:ABC-type protease/lipase transport system fused ATPase/permease subunit
MAVASVAGMINMIGSGVSIAAGTILVIHAMAAPGSIMAVMIISGRGLEPLDKISGNLAMWRSAALAMRRLHENLAEQAPAPAGAVPLPPEPEAPGLAVRGLTVTVPGRDRPLVEGLEKVATL